MANTFTARLVSDSDEAAWTAFLKEQGIRHHAFSWNWRQIFERSFRHELCYALVEQRQSDSPDSETTVAGVLPLVHVKSILFGNALVSLPFLNAGGIVASCEQSFRELLQFATGLAEEREAQYIELRHREPCHMADPGLQVRSHKVAMVLPLRADPEELFASFPAKLRSQIRRPTKEGVRAHVSGEDLSIEKSLAAFYSVFAENMRDLGTPVYSKRLFRNVLDSFGARSRIITVWHRDRPLAAGLTVGSDTSDSHPEVEIPWASSLRRFKHLSPNMLLYWETIKTACSDGYQTFNFGRSSPDSGTFRFKRQWGSTAVPLHWYYHVREGDIPDINPHSPRFSRAVECWKRLPLPVTQVVGPWISHSIP